MLNENLSVKAQNLLEQQKHEWEGLRKGYDSLKTVKNKTIQFDGYTFTIQFNPQRITSTAAKTDAASIKERKCFLCKENRPTEQKEIDLGNYYLLCNPFPVLSEHYTIPSKIHQPQRIKDNFSTMIQLAESFSGKYAVFYNGPECGASAPDHLHFQAGSLKEFNIITEADGIKNQYGTTLYTESNIEIISADDNLRKLVFITGENKEELVSAFNKVYSAISTDDKEPKINIIVHYKEKFEIIIFLREKHRPHQFFAEGEDKLTFSPAGIDCGGLCVTPIEKDFNRLDKKLVADVFAQVFISKIRYNQIIELITHKV